ncbi:MAG: PAS domain-containing protein [Pseudomonadota bacterium]
MSKEKKPNFNLQSILDSHENPFVLIDESYTIVEANRAYCACYDTSPSEIVGSKCHMVHHNSELPCHSYGEECPMQRVMETGDRYEVCHVHHNHEYNPECVSVKGFPIADEDGNRYLGEEIVQAARMADAAEKNAIQSTEARYIARLLVEHHGHRRKVAERLKVSERTLYRKLVNYNLTNVGKNT